MYNRSIEPNIRINGVYHHQGYYCVWTANRTELEQYETDVHEQCHALVDLDYEHFCGGDR